MKKCNNIIITLSEDLGNGEGSVSRKLNENYEAQGLKSHIVSLGDLIRKIVVREYKKKFPDVQEPSLEEIYSNPAFAEEIKKIDENMDNEIANLVEEFYLRTTTGEVLILDSRRVPIIIEKLAEKIPDISQICFNVMLEKDAKIAGGCIEQYRKDLTDRSHFDLIIGTKLASIEDIANTIQICEQLKKEEKPFTKTWASPELFYPTQNIEVTIYDEVWIVEDPEERLKSPDCPFATTEKLRKIYPDKRIDHNTIRIGKWVRGTYDLDEFAHLIQEKGIYPDKPIDAISMGQSEFYLIDDGHHRVFGSIKACKTLIPYRTVKHLEEETLSQEQLDIIDIHEHEIGRKLDGSKFKYPQYPKCKQEQYLDEPEQK